MAEQPQTASSSSQPSQKSPESSLNQPQVPVQSGYLAVPNGDFQMFPIMYPFLSNPHQNQENMNRGSGLYAVPIYPFGGPVAGIPSNTLIPLTYNVPTRTSTESGATSEGRGQEGQHPNNQQQQRGQNQQPAQQRQVVVRRFQIAIRLDLFLILKLVAVIFLFNQDGSRQRLVVLIIFALLIYLNQTGSLTPLIRWLSQGMRRAPRAVARPENVPPPLVRRGVVDGPLEDVPEGAENENRAANDNNNNNNNDEPVENENLAERNGPNLVNQWWAIVKEIQMIVFGFITSLLPGFHNID